MKTVYLLLINGFEEIEALTPVDLLRRAGVPVKTVGLSGKTVTGSHDIPVVADIDGEGFTLPEDAGMLVLPGGPGTADLEAHPVTQQALKDAEARGLYIAAICAAPTILHAAGLLKGKRATAFPTRQAEIAAEASTNVTGGVVEVDGNIITGRAMGVSLQFAHALATAMAGKEAADAEVAKVYPEQ